MRELGPPLNACCRDHWLPAAPLHATCSCWLPLGQAHAAHMPHLRPTTPFPGTCPCSVYTSPDTLVSPPDASGSFMLQISPAIGNASALTFTEIVTSGTRRTCSDAGVTVWSSGSCPDGTAPDPNPEVRAAAASGVTRLAAWVASSCLRLQLCTAAGWMAAQSHCFATQSGVE